jgi:cytochrome P450
MTASVETTPTYPFGRRGLHPSRVYEALFRSQGPLAKTRLYDGREAWLLTRFEDVRAIVGHPAVSHDVGRDDFPKISPRGWRKPGPGDFILMDAPEHTRLRRMLAPEFTFRRIERLRPRVERIVDELIDDLLNGPKPVDFVDAFAYPVPSRTICELLGVPYEDHDFFETQTKVFASMRVSHEQLVAAVKALSTYLAQLVDRKFENPGDDLISRMLDEHVRPGHLTREALVSMTRILLGAGHETTGNMIALGVFVLLANPTHFAEMRSDPAIVPGAVEEFLRYLSIIESTVRVAREDFKFNGVTIKQGDAILAVLAAANRDQLVFPDPDRLDLNREARNHVAFGYGTHVCLGAPLARVELQAAYGAIARRIPDLRLAVAVEDVEFKGETTAFGVVSLPVTW